MTEIKVNDIVLYNGTLKGTVEFIGTTHFAAGTWYGIKLEVPKGKNDGSVGGTSYFKCEKNYGLFVKPNQLTHYVERELVKTEIKDKPMKTGIRKPSVVKTRNVNNLTSSPESNFEPDIQESTSELEKSTECIVAATSSTDDNNTNMELMQMKVKDLEEKLQTLQIKRSEDKEKLKELDKLRLMVQQLEENKKHLQERSGEYQRSLDKMKQDYAKLNEEFDQFKEETSSMSENIEMLTIDKEMAEEKLDSYRLQIDELNSKVEEVTLENEIIKLEQKGGSNGGSGSGVDETQINFIKTQNTKLRDAIIVLRDLSENQKAELERLSKENIKMESELDRSNKERVRLTNELKEAQENIIDLKEQVDSSLGADEMVNTLTEKNLSLEELVKKLEDEKAELEELCDMNNEINENNSSIISDMKIELSTCNFNIQELNKALVSKNECILDYEDTIDKFRELVKDLQAQVKEYKLQVEINSSTVGGDSIKSNDVANQEILLAASSFKSKVNKANELAELIDNKLQELSVDQGSKHVEYLQRFLPENFFKGGNGNDAVLIVLLIDRMINKVDILTNQITENFLSNDENAAVDPVNAIYYQRLCYLLSNWYLILRHFNKTLSCSSELTFQRLISLYNEMSPNEKSIDYLFDLMKKGHLDRRTSLEPLERSINYFQTFYQVHLANEQTFSNMKLGDVSKSQIIAANIIGDACKFITSKSQRLKWTDESNAEIFDKFQSFHGDLLGLSKNIRKLTALETMLVLPKDISEKLDNANNDLARFVNLLGGFTMEIANKLEDEDTEVVPISSLYTHMKKYPEISHIQDNITLFNRLDRITDICTLICDSVEQGKYDCSTNSTANDKKEEPLVQLATKFKNDISELESNCSKLSVKDEELKQAKLNFKLKNEELSEMSIRLSIVEKKLSSTVKTKDEIIERLEQKYEQVKASLSRKERELDQTSEALQSDINHLEAQKEELRKQIKQTRQRNFLDNVNMPSSKIAEYHESQFADVEALNDTIKNLKQIINLQQKRIHKLRQEQLSRTISQMPKLAPIVTDHETDLVKNASAMSDTAEKLSGDIYNFVSNIKVIDLSNYQSKQTLNHQIEADQLKSSFDKIKVMREQLMEKSKSSANYVLQKTPNDNLKLVGRVNFSEVQTKHEQSLVVSQNVLSKLNRYFA